MKKKIFAIAAALIVAAAAAVSLSACGQNNEGTIATSSVTEEQQQMVDLLSTGYYLSLPSTFQQVDTTIVVAENKVGGVMAFQSNDGMKMDVAIVTPANLTSEYKDVKDLKSFTEADMKVTKGKDMQTGKVNDIDYTVYTTENKEEINGVKCLDYVYTVELDKDEYLQISFCNGNKDVSAETKAIMDTMTYKAVANTLDYIHNAEYSIDIPEKLVAVDVSDKDAVEFNTVASYEAEDGLMLDVNAFNSKAMPTDYKDVTDLKSFAETDAKLFNGTDLQEAQANGITYYKYTSHEEIDGKEQTGYIYCFKDGNMYVQFCFYNDKADCAKEAQAIVDTVKQVNIEKEIEEIEKEVSQAIGDFEGAVKEIANTSYSVKLPLTLMMAAVPESLEQHGVTDYFTAEDGLNVAFAYISNADAAKAYPNAKDLKSFAEADAKEYGGTDVKEGKINGVEYVSFTIPADTKTESGKTSRVLVYNFKDEDGYVQLAFTNGDNDVSQQATEIITTITKK